MEQQRRLAAKLASAIAKHMSDAKWLALFETLRCANTGEIRWKFVSDERVFTQSIPDVGQLLPDRFGDVLPAPYGPFREIEWVEVPADQEALYERLRTAAKQFPWQESASGLRLVAYEWQAAPLGPSPASP